MRRDDDVSGRRMYGLLQVVDVNKQPIALYTLDNTKHGRLLFIFRPPSRELDNFRAWAQRSLKAGYSIETMVVVADNLEQVHSKLQESNLLPEGSNCVSVEGTPFFNQVIRELIDNTIWQ